MLESRFNLLGLYNDDPTGASAARTRQVSLQRDDFGEFKVPSLRNLLLTAPYGRDGNVDTIAQVVQHRRSRPRHHPRERRTTGQAPEPHPARAD